MTSAFPESLTERIRAEAPQETTMHSHQYKKVERRPTEPTIRELVTKHGDDWIIHAPMRYRYEPRADRNDPWLMISMERGKWPRV